MPLPRQIPSPSFLRPVKLVKPFPSTRVFAYSSVKPLAPLAGAAGIASFGLSTAGFWVRSLRDGCARQSARERRHEGAFHLTIRPV
jgi:hypothetical protein